MLAFMASDSFSSKEINWKVILAGAALTAYAWRKTKMERMWSVEANDFFGVG
jgi:hypothetical protein